ncbi:MAG: DUF4336 domain-containing protein [Polyangiales bacterium]
MEQIASNLWAAAAPNSFFGLHLGTRMSVLRLKNGGLLMHSPIPLAPDLKAEVDALGPVRHIVAPNIYHHLSAGDWKDAYPDALLHAATGLEKRRKDLPIDLELKGDAHSDWAGDLETMFLDGTMLNETVFFQPSSRTLIVSDVIENFETSPHWPTRMYLKLGGIHGKPGLSRPLRMVFRDKPAARRAIDQMLDWDFDRIVLAHGDIIERDGREHLRDAYTWLEG